MLHWRLLSTRTRVVLVAAVIAVVVVLILGVSGDFSAILTFVAIALVLIGAYLRRQDLNRAIAAQLQREAEDDAERDQRG